MAQTSGWHHPSFSQLQIDRRSDFTLHFSRDKLNTPRGPQSLARWKGEGRVEGEGGEGEVSTLCPSGIKVLVLFFLPSKSVLLAVTIREGKDEQYTGYAV